MSDANRWIDRVHVGDCRELLDQMAIDGIKVQTCVTSPPYFRLRDYGMSNQIGLEPSPTEFIEELVRVFRRVRELLTADGTLWLVIGDSYAARGARGRGNLTGLGDRYAGGGRKHDTINRPPKSLTDGMKPKDLLGIPWRVALALQADGWYLRADIIEEVEMYCPCGCGFLLEERIWRWSQDRDLIWSKPNAVPESVRDRPTRSHEYVFLLSKSERYHYDWTAIRERARSSSSDSRKMVEGLSRSVGKNEELVGPFAAAGAGTNTGRKPAVESGYWRNKRSIWTVATVTFKGSHFAAFPPKLIEPCILAASRPGDTVLDPFIGSSTTGQVATSLGRHYIGCELNPAYRDLAGLRGTTLGMLL